MINILFDMDGVLVQSEHIMRKASILALSEYGVTAVDEDFKDFVGMGEDLFVGGVAEKHNVPYQAEMKDRAYDIYVDIVDDLIVRYEGVYTLLDYITQNNITCAVASSADLIKVTANLKAGGISRDIFKTIVSGNDVKRKKPYPDIYLYTANKIGVLPKDCLVVEDAISGLLAAKAAGMKCVIVTTSFDREELLPHNPDYIVDDVAEIIDILRSDFNYA